MPETPLPPPLERIRVQLHEAATHLQSTPPRPTWRSRSSRLVAKPLPIALIATAFVGTATAAVVVTTTTNSLDSRSRPDAPAVSSVLGILDRFGSDGGGQARRPLQGSQVRGLTTTRDGIQVDVATDGQQLCFSGHSAGVTRLTGLDCVALPIPADAIPFSSGIAGSRTYLMAIVPDGTSRVVVTSTSGEEIVAQIDDNIAVAVLPEGGVAGLGWTTPDGRSFIQTPGEQARITSR